MTPTTVPSRSVPTGSPELDQIELGTMAIRSLTNQYKGQLEGQTRSWNQLQKLTFQAFEEGHRGVRFRAYERRIESEHSANQPLESLLVDNAYRLDGLHLFDHVHHMTSAYTPAVGSQGRTPVGALAVGATQKGEAFSQLRKYLSKALMRYLQSQYGLLRLRNHRNKPILHRPGILANATAVTLSIDHRRELRENQLAVNGGIIL